MTEDEPLRCQSCDHNVPRDRREDFGDVYDAMVQLDGWQHSNGARLEAEIADALGIKRASLREVLENPRLPREDA